MRLFKKCHIKDFPKYNKRAASWVEEHCYFSVRIGPALSLLGPSKRKRFNIYRNILDRFIPLADDFYIYDLNYNSDTVKPFHKHLVKDRSRYKIRFGYSGWKTLDRLLYSPAFKRSIKETRGGIIGRCRLDDTALKSIFEHCCDPTVIDNAALGCGRNALNAAKRSDETGVFFVIIETLNSGLESITLVSNKKDILHIYDIASKYCKISRSYRDFHIRIYDSVDSKDLKKV
ncbi:MAG: hypothetical protein JXA06_11875 [Bacteroidetes bacterium]|nr:hypothetical protein [Bacteroidota bacterium]